MHDISKLFDISTLDEKQKPEYAWKLISIQFDYGWKYFDFHAKQRTTMFNFFILFAGMLANAYVLLLNKDFFLLSLLTAIFGMFISFTFIFIDRRNEELVHIAEDVLLYIEKNFLFNEIKCDIKWPRQRDWFGKMKFELKRRQIGIFMREEADEESNFKSKYSHGKWLTKIQEVIAVLFFLFSLYSIYMLI